ncbi:acyltransferase family protein [Carnobacterium gallinarum]|uniref:acyltransferase family protein n=1 Tax=Carnobacterium gallinarum TaxID=2749 RepID=UPI000557C613|nr:acyltransferase family protein [Carnobacterium gallinarum]
MENQKRLKKSRYMSGLDGIRALAVLGVIFYHLTPHMVPGGFLGVPIFFVLSGYLITDLLIQEFEQNQKISLKQFWKRRLNRLYPALVTMLILVTGWITIFERNLLLNIRNTIISSLLYLNNWWQIMQGDSYFDRFATPSPFVHLWSLAIEGQFYLIWPILVVVAIVFIKKNIRIFWTFMGVALVSGLLMAFLYVPGGDPSRVYYGTDTRSFSLLIGSALAFVWPSNRLKATIPRKGQLTLDAIGLVASVGLIFMMVTVTDNNPFTYYGGIFIYSLISAVLIGVTAHPATWFSKLLSVQPLKWLGERSYGLYLWQYPIMVLYEVKVGDTSLQPIRHLIIQLVLIIVIAEASYRFIEMPFKKLNVRAILNGEVLINRLKEFWQEKSPKAWIQKAGVVLLSLVLIVSLVGFITAPVGDSPATIRLAEKLRANKAKIEKQKTDKEKDKNAQQLPVKQAVYGLSDEQMKVASQMDITFVGDSVLLSVVSPLEEVFPLATIDGEIGRQLYNTLPVVTTLKQQNKLGNPVVLELGTNGAFTDKQIDDLILTIGEKRKIYIINTQVPKNWKNSVNQGIKNVATRYKNIQVIDWNSYSAGKTDWFYEDGVHPNEIGAEQYAELIAKAILTDQKK